MPTSLPDLLQLLVALWIGWVLVRSARNAWASRDLLLLVWGRIRPATVLQALGLFVLVAVTATVLLEFVPPLRWGLGRLVAFEGNAVFTPLEQAAGALGPAPETGPDWGLAIVTTAFLGFLVVLLPWLAFIEEELFRAGTEVLDLRGEVLAALRFGLAHLVMLVPIGAALAIAVGGFAYGRVYRRRANAPELLEPPPAALRAFRPTRRSREAVLARRDEVAEGLVVATLEGTVERRQVEGVLASTVLHTTFNTLVVLIVWLAVVVPALSR